MVEFLLRGTDGISLVATLTYPGKWQGEPAIKKMVESLTHRLLGGKFDPRNKEHYKLLPKIISGTRQWAVYTKLKKKSVLELLSKVEGYG